VTSPRHSPELAESKSSPKKAIKESKLPEVANSVGEYVRNVSI
jgi:hypothetical protein